MGLLALSGCILLFAQPPPRVERELHPGNVVSVAAGDGSACAVYASGWIACSGNATDHPSLDRGYKSVAGDDDGWCAVGDDGGVYCWGGIPDPAVPDTGADPVGVDAIAVAHGTGCMLRGTAITCWGADDSNGDPIPVGPYFSGIALGPTEGCAMETDRGPGDLGQVFCFGSGLDARSGTRVDHASALAVSLGEGCVILDDLAANDGREPGGVDCWTSGSASFAGPAGTFDAITAGDWTFCALSGGGATCWPSDHLPEDTVNTPPDEAFAQLDPGGTTSCGITTAGDGVCWGDTTGIGL